MFSLQKWRTLNKNKTLTEKYSFIFKPGYSLWFCVVVCLLHIFHLKINNILLIKGSVNYIFIDVYTQNYWMCIIVINWWPDLSYYTWLLYFVAMVEQFKRPLLGISLSF